MRRCLLHIFSQACRGICVLGLLCCFASCRWQEAREVIAMADSIDQNHHVIYDDTAALGQTIRTLDNPFGRLLMSNTLGKAYYYMGRNFSLSNQIPEAADCYIEADRLQIDDAIYRGRINSCMGYICAQNKSDSLALIFYERANGCFLEGSDEWRYAQSLLNIIQCYICLQQYQSIDSLLQTAYSYQLDDAYIARYLETVGMYHHALQQYDSALVYYNSGINYWSSEEARCFSYMKIMQACFHSNKMDSALHYAHKLITISDNPNYLVNAYYCLMQDAKRKNNVEMLSQYSHIRTDMQVLLRNSMVKDAEVLPKLEEYFLNPHPMRWVWFVLFACVVLFVILVISLLVYRRFANAQLQVSNEQIVSLLVQLDSQQDELNEHTKLHIYDKRLASIRRQYPTPSTKWNKYDLLKGDINSYLRNWLAALDQLSLTNRDKVYCVLSFIYPHMSAEELAKYMCVTKDAVLVRKARIVKKLQITSEQFGSFLLNLSKK